MACRTEALLFLLVLGVALAPAVAADSYRCGRQLVRDGDSTARLLRSCGAPRARDRGTETVRIDGRVGPRPVERWYYRKNRRSLEYAVLVYRGRIVAIRVVGR